MKPRLIVAILMIAGLPVCAEAQQPSGAKAKHTYQYAATESVVATCLATTFFSHDNQPAATPATAKGRT